MGLKDDFNEIKNEVEELKSSSIAMDLLNDYKKQNKRLFIIIILLCVMLTGIGIYTIWLLNDIEVVETTETTENYNQDIDNGGNIDNTNIVNGGNVNGKN